MKKYKVTITDGNDIGEYKCSLHTELDFKLFKYWFHVKTQRGPLVKVCNTALHWGNMFHCEPIDKTLETWVNDLKVF